MFYDLCQSTVALRKQHKLLLQHITSRGSRLAPFKPRWPLASFSTLGGRIPPPPPICSLASSGPESDMGSGCWEDGPCWILQDPHQASHRVALPTSTTCCPNKLSSLCPLTPSPAHEQHAVLWCAAPAPPPFQLYCNQPQGQNKTSRGGKCLTIVKA